MQCLWKETAETLKGTLLAEKALRCTKNEHSHVAYLVDKFKFVATHVHSSTVFILIERKQKK